MTSLLPQLLWLRTLADDEEQIEPRTAILFPWLVELIGILALIFLTRYVPQFPYTAAMFLLGTFMGMANSKLDNDSLLHQSIDQWLSINSELLLGVFLPGLIFKDALGLDFHLFTKGLSQIMVLAFPMVLAGTALTALVAYLIWP
jgi:NhaP-type Na+/H+ or K+/H+ antiporter